MQLCSEYNASITCFKILWFWWHYFLVLYVWVLLLVYYVCVGFIISVLIMW